MRDLKRLRYTNAGARGPEPKRLALARFSPFRRQAFHGALGPCPKWPALAPMRRLSQAGALLAFCLVINGCHPKQNSQSPAIEFTHVPHASEGGPDKLETIGGRVIGALPGQQIVLFAKWGPWWVQPRVDRPYTEIQSDLRWRNATHLGTEYAAVLVDPGFHPDPTMGSLPALGNGVIVTATIKGRPPFWLTWWFLLATTVLLALAISMVFRLRMVALVHQMNMRFEERLAERTRIARELHDSLLQGFQGLMLRLQAVRDLLPGRATEAMEALESALDHGDEAIAEGRDTVENLRGYSMVNTDMVQALTALGEELRPEKDTVAPPLRVFVQGQRRDLDPILRDEIYRIAREALRNAFNHAQAREIEAQLTYGNSQFLLHIRDNGTGIDPSVFDQGRRAGHWGLPGMRERAKEFGGKVKVWSEAGHGTEVELSVPASIAYGNSSVRPRFWFMRKGISGTHDRQS